MSLKRIVCRCCVAFLLAGAVVVAQQVPPNDPIVQKALAIHRRATTLDSHIDIFTYYTTPALDPGTETTVQCDLPKMERGGLDGAFFIVFVPQGPLDESGYEQAYQQAMVKFDALRRLTEQMHPIRAASALTPGDVRRIAESGKRAILIGVENGYPMGTDLANLRKFYDLGARDFSLTQRENNQLADSSSAAAPLHHGLSPLGVKAVAELNRLGMLNDVSHLSEEAFWAVIAATRAPIIASHSSCASLTDSDRNLTDEQLKALARNGDVVQIAPVPNYIRPEDPAHRAAVAELRRGLGLTDDAVAAWRTSALALSDERRAHLGPTMAQFRDRKKAFDARYPPGSPTLEDFVDHLDHAVKVAGIDRVGIGSDFDAGRGVPGFRNCAEAPNVTIELVRRGYTEEQIGKIWGQNLLRVWREAAKTAASSRAVARSQVHWAGGRGKHGER
jgi:membrane dipeptidase